MSPAFLAVFPGFVAGLTGARDRIGAPRRLAGVEFGRLDEAPDASFPAGVPNDGEIADDERCDSERLSQRRVGNLALPGDFAGRFVDGKHAAVEGN